MTNFVQFIIVILVVSIAVCNSLPERLENIRSPGFGRRQFARQQATVTPYPPAGIAPEIPFNLPTDGKLVGPDNTYLPPVEEPAQTYGPPAKTYGPPEVDVRDEVEEVATNDPLQSEQPSDEQPEEEEKVSSEQPLPSEEDPQVNELPEDEIRTAEEIEAEIRRVEEEEGLLSAAKLTSAKLQAQPIYVINHNGQLYRLLQ